MRPACHGHHLPGQGPIDLAAIVAAHQRRALRFGAGFRAGAFAAGAPRFDFAPGGLAAPSAEAFGAGFSAASVPDHEQPQSLMLEHGRGIRIMQEWLDELLYYRNGACAWLSRRRADARLP